MLHFLNRILASGGLRCAATIKNKKCSHEWFETNEALAEHLKNSSTKADAYHCNATFPIRGSRRKNDGCLYRSVWVDCDLGFDTSLAALKVSIDRGLPPPNIIVSSGGGLHAYWVFTRDISLDEWGSAATSLASLCKSTGLHIDNKCTVDAVRVLRPPGTLNHKYGPPPVVEAVETGVADYEVAGFIPEHLPSAVDISPRLANPVDDRGGYIPLDSPPSDPDLIAQQCANMRYFKETGCAKEGEEPLWKACIGVLAFSENSETTAHAWSRVDPRYDAVECNKKLHDRTKLSGSSLCRQFENETDLASRARCEGCRFRGKINSPISLGYGNVVDLASPRGDNASKRLMPDGFHVGSGVKIDDWSGQKNIEITAFPLFFTGRSSGESENGETWDTWDWETPHKTKLIRVRAGSRSYASDMAGQGVIIRHHDPFMSYVKECQTAETKLREDGRHYECFGWKDDDTTFLWGNQFYRQAQPASRVAIIDRSLDDRAAHLRPGGRYGKGTLDAWKANIRGLLQPGFEIQQLALLASVGAIFIHFLAPSEGGAILHLVSPGSGTGKTTALKIAASVWGDIEGLSSTVDDTATSKSIKWGYIRHLPLIFDELVERDPTAAERLVRTFTVGSDKSRARIDGSGLQENTREWSTILISAGNSSVVNIVNRDARSAMAERVLEFNKEFPPEMTIHQRSKGQTYANGVAANCGWAGKEILEAIFIDDTSVLSLSAAVKQAEMNLWDRCRAWHQERRYWVRALSSMHVAGVLMNALGLIEFDVERVITWALKELDARNDQEDKDKVKPEEVLTSYLDMNLAVTIVMAGAYAKGTPDGILPNCVAEGHKPPFREVFIRRELDTDTILINRSHFRAWCTTNGHHPGAILTELEEKHIVLNRAARATLSAGTPLRSGQQPCLLISGGALACFLPDSKS